MLTGKLEFHESVLVVLSTNATWNFGGFRLYPVASNRAAVG